jgi:hypothetical protein
MVLPIASCRRNERPSIGHSPTRSGVDLIPYVLLTSGFNVISGVFVSKFGRYWHLLVIIPLIASVASSVFYLPSCLRCAELSCSSGLEYTINETTTEAKLVGYQILWGFAIGTTLQLPTIAVQGNVPCLSPPSVSSHNSFIYSSRIPG